jgi:hypothetical protein
LDHACCVTLFHAHDRVPNALLQLLRSGQ